MASIYFYIKRRLGKSKIFKIKIEKVLNFLIYALKKRLLRLNFWSVIFFNKFWEWKKKLEKFINCELKNVAIFNYLLQVEMIQQNPFALHQPGNLEIFPTMNSTSKVWLWSVLKWNSIHHPIDLSLFSSFSYCTALVHVSGKCDFIVTIKINTWFQFQ